MESLVKVAPFFMAKRKRSGWVSSWHWRTLANTFHLHYWVLHYGIQTKAEIVRFFSWFFCEFGQNRYLCTTFLNRYKFTDFMRDLQRVLWKSFWRLFQEVSLKKYMSYEWFGKDRRKGGVWPNRVQRPDWRQGDVHKKPRQAGEGAWRDGVGEEEGML